ncbi:MAG TPA: hypothetical protein VFF30_14410 [Nitrososphaerales archaeon]|nr:hypothetical protein [Nitrososphaerales archaeon]
MMPARYLNRQRSLKVVLNELENRKQATDCELARATGNAWVTVRLILYMHRPGGFVKVVKHDYQKFKDVGSMLI